MQEQMVIEKEALRNYLLGRVTEADNDEIGMRVIEDGEISTAITMAENELVEEYIEGELTDEEAKLFRENFLVSDDRRDLLNEVALLKRYSSGPAKAYLTSEIRAHQAASRRFGPTAWAAILLVCTVAAGIFVWNAYRSGRESSIAQQFAELNAGDLSDLSHYPSMSLASRVDGSPAPETRFATSGPGTSFMFRLPVNNATGRYDAVYRLNGTEVFKAFGLRVYAVDRGGEVRLLLPREMLKPGQASITLTHGGGGESQSFPFIAE